ncbi:LuxR C-terminal-related transcriptional regulator [Amycolatopsis sp. NPDC058986]|uniref:helix-turn-helix transcriptional regulator n=1 Tax=unclassified Amycolatopsis TaxID=2618356 RepID=UPI003671229C
MNRSSGVSARRSNTEAGEDIRVVLLDAVPIFREALAERIGRSCGMMLHRVTRRVAAAAHLCEQGGFDVLIMDSLLDPRGHLVRFAATSGRRLAILSLVREPLIGEFYLRTALRAGAHGLIRRAAQQDQLWEAVAKVFHERYYLDPGLGFLLSEQDPTRDRRAFGGLSRREFEVLQQVADGLTTVEMATKLCISTETVRSHVKSICRKLGVHDRTHAVAEGFHRGLLTPDMIVRRNAA